MATERSNIKIRYADGDWAVQLDGRNIENNLAHDGLRVEVAKPVEDVPIVHLTFVDVDLDADLDALVAATKVEG